MFDRRKNPREFLVAGWDPYVIQLTAESRSENKPDAYEPPQREPVITRWRTMLLRRAGTG